MRAFSVLLLTVAAIAFSTACEKEPSTYTLTGPTATSEAVSVSIIGERQLLVGQTTRLRAIAAMRDGTNRDVSNEAVWQSSNTIVCSAGAGGVIVPANAGICDLTVTYNSIATTTSFSVVVDTWTGEIVSIEVLGPRVLAAGEGDRYIVIGHMPDGSHLEVTAGTSFESSVPSVADVDRDGRVGALSEGSTTITVVAGGLQVAFRLTVFTPAQAP